MKDKKIKLLTKKNTHELAWLISLLALPVAVITAIKGATPLQVAVWLGAVAIVQLLYLLPEALKEKEVYNDDVE